MFQWLGVFLYAKLIILLDFVLIYFNKILSSKNLCVTQIPVLPL